MRRYMFLLMLAVVSAATAFPADEGKDQPTLVNQARQALHKAGAYLSSIATHGGYLWEYTVDLQQRWGEGKATATQVWVQPPGTPAVGAALLKAWQATGDESLKAAAEAAGDALIWGQLECGGWHYMIDFSPEAEKRWYYRHLKGREGLDTKRLRNSGTFDDNNTQSATSLLIALATATGEERFAEAARYALDYFLRAQYENGGWPQWYPLVGRYHDYYTFNDAAINDIIRVLLEAWHAFGDEKYLQAAEKGGKFIVLSQGKPPQAAWAQQYDMDLKPAWARKFEPPSWCSAVTARNIRTLITLYLETGKEEYLQPIPSAIEWLKASQLKGGEWARFYELGTNKPLYFTRDYKLTYSDADCPTHYSFKGNYGATSAMALYERVRELGRQGYKEQMEAARSPEALRQRAQRLTQTIEGLVASQDDAGRWVRGGRVKMQDFVHNLGLLAEYVQGYGEKKQ
ncbi:MAG: hypothetical protein J7M26_02625 [Armatimonadetes bacterium]|nr:hypothetical protein [Armatimonadota bacterium]